MKYGNRHSIRLKGYDYSQAGYYFVTICCQNRAHLFGKIVDGQMELNDAGRMVEQIWNEIPKFYNGFECHQFVVMPNHIHGIIEHVGAGPRACPNNGQPNDIIPRDGQPRGVAPTSLPDIVHRYKTLTTKRYIDGVDQHGWKRFDKRIWQRNYWEHIIRNENEFRRITQYIRNNPQKWSDDKLNGGIGNSVLEAGEGYAEEIWMV